MDIMKALRNLYQTFIGILVHIRGFLCCKMCHSTAMLTGKTVLITGGNKGIGKETSLDLAARGANVIIACRDVKKGDEVVNEIKEKVPSAKITVKYLDLASFKSIRAFAADIFDSVSHIHILINNAGVAGVPNSETEDGFEMEFGVNYLGHFLLTTLLLDKIKESAPARIVNVSSILHILGKIDFSDINLKLKYPTARAYGRSKLAILLFTKELAKRLEGSGVTTYSLHPGGVHTEISQNLGSTINKFVGILYNTVSKLIFMNPRKGAQTTIHCAVEESIAQESGFYYCDCTRIAPSAKARDDTTAQKLWEISESLTALV